MMPMRAATDFDDADVIVVFGAGMTADGVLATSSRLRVARGVALFKAGKAPVMHFTGGVARPEGPSAGDQMAQFAMDFGVPATSITTEGRSQSTLQNALFSASDLQDAQSLILVSEGFHLPRVATTMIWAGPRAKRQWAASARFRTHGGRPLYTASRMVFREAVAWWFNIARATAYSVAGLIGVDASTREGWLA